MERSKKTVREVKKNKVESESPAQILWSKQVEAAKKLVEGVINTTDINKQNAKEARLLDFVQKLQIFANQPTDVKVNLAEFKTVLVGLFIESLPEFPVEVIQTKNGNNGEIIFRSKSDPQSERITPKQVMCTILEHGLSDGVLQTSSELKERYQLSTMPTFQIFSRILRNKQLRDIIYNDNNCPVEDLNLIMENGRSIELDRKISEIKKAYNF